MDTRSLVSTGRKLLHNVECLLAARTNKPRPVMFHVCLTNSCQLSCRWCCYADRERGASIPLDKMLSFADASADLGTRTWEITGGGEPLLYPKINELLAYLDTLGFSVGLMTNGMALWRLEKPAFLKWIRVSLSGVLQGKAKEVVRQIDTVRMLTKVTGYCVFDVEDLPLFPEIAAFAEELEMPVKLEPNYYQSREVVDALAVELRNKSAGHPLLFVNYKTDFSRSSDRCYVHLIKPFLYTDGWVCTCPLPIGESKTVAPEFRVCRMENVRDYYQHHAEPVRYHACRFCRYSEHNAIADGVLSPIDDGEFC